MFTVFSGDGVADERRFCRAEVEVRILSKYLIVEVVRECLPSIRTQWLEKNLFIVYVLTLTFM